MDRAELEGLDRDALIARAEAAGVTRARILTRPELVDELLLRGARAGDRAAKRARGFFGRARDLLARVIELGLNLPEAAEKLRTAAVAPPPQTQAALPTVTLAEIYAAQGHRDRAVDTLKKVIEREPEHAAARALLERLDGASASFPAAPVMPPEPEEEPTTTATETATETATSTATSIVEAAVSADGLVVRWESRESTLARLASAFPDGRGVLRILVIEPTWDGPRSAVRDLEVEARRGERVLRGLPEGAIIRAAVGWRTDEGFAPIAHV